MRISDWSSDVCSSDLRGDVAVQDGLHVLGDRQLQPVTPGQAHDFIGGLHRLDHLADLAHRVVQGLAAAEREAEAAVARQRSEEHTSELQSLMRISYAVFCLKTKKTKHTHTRHYRSID